MLATPNVLAQWLTIYDQHPSIDVHFDTIVSGGSALTRSLIERIRPRLCSHLVTGYGATETGMSAAAPAHRIAHIEGAVGYVTPGARIEIVDDVDRPVPAGTEGIVRVASEWAVDRYIGDPIGSAQAFRNRWFYPGDLGSLTSDDVLIISGRQNNVLNIGGAKIPAETVTAVLSSFSGVSDAAAFVVTNRLGVDEVLAAVTCREKISAENLRSYCQSRMPPPFVPAQIVILDAMPLSDTGKVDRMRLKEMVARTTHS